MGTGFPPKNSKNTMNGVLFIYDLISIFVSDPKKAATNWFVCEKDYFYRNATLILQFL